MAPSGGYYRPGSGAPDRSKANRTGEEKRDRQTQRERERGQKEDRGKTIRT